MIEPDDDNLDDEAHDVCALAVKAYHASLAAYLLLNAIARGW